MGVSNTYTTIELLRDVTKSNYEFCSHTYWLHLFSLLDRPYSTLSQIFRFFWILLQHIHVCQVIDLNYETAVQAIIINWAAVLTGRFRIHFGIVKFLPMPQLCHVISSHLISWEDFYTNVTFFLLVCNKKITNVKTPLDLLLAFSGPFNLSIIELWLSWSSTFSFTNKHVLPKLDVTDTG